MKKKKKYKLYIYANRHFIKRIKIDEDEDVFNKIYVINVFFKKYILGSNFVKIIVRPILLKYTDEIKREMHVEATLFDGVSEGV